MEKFAHIQPWYRQFWPWFIIALPLTAVIASITTLIIAAHDPDGLVADDYYKQGLAINQILDRERRAQTLGLSGLLRVDTSTQRILLTLDGPLNARNQKVMVQGIAMTVAGLLVTLIISWVAARDAVLVARRRNQAC